jgi:cytochrome c-type biogenesis protein CcmH/NrfG
MTPSDRSAAEAALATGRAIYSRLDQIRGPEDAAADLIELWGAVESAMRAMLGGSLLSGQALVRELRQRGLLTFDQANTLASFWDARSRVETVDYKPTLTDVGYGRAGFNDLTEAVREAAKPATVPEQNTNTIAPVAPTETLPYEAALFEKPRSRRMQWSAPVIAAIAVVAILIVAGGAYLLFGRSSYDKQMARGVDLMHAGQPEAARAVFAQVILDHPDQAEPHVFLSRLDRTDGNVNTAKDELVTAIRLEPKNALALREMGLLLLSQHDPSLAKNFLIRAVQAAPSDSAAQGYLGCALMQLKQVDAAQRFLSRAGPGSWSACATPVTSSTS